MLRRFDLVRQFWSLSEAEVHQPTLSDLGSATYYYIVFLNIQKTFDYETRILYNCIIVTLNLNIMENKSIIASAILACGIVCGGLAIMKGLTDMNSKRTVSVKGLSEKEVMADHVIWPIVYDENGNDLADIYSSIENKNKSIIEYLESNGIDKNEIAIGQTKINDNTSYSYNNNATYRYVVTSVVTVSTDKVDLVCKLMGQNSELMKKGIAIKGNNDWDNNVQFTYTKLNDIKVSMLQESTENARKAAEVFAEKSDSKIGKIVNSNQGQFSIESRDQYTPQIKSIRVVTSVEYELD